jgi:hypothetical protein
MDMKDISVDLASKTKVLFNMALHCKMCSLLYCTTSTTLSNGSSLQNVQHKTRQDWHVQVVLLVSASSAVCFVALLLLRMF